MTLSDLIQQGLPRPSDSFIGNIKQDLDFEFSKLNNAESKEEHEYIYAEIESLKSLLSSLNSL